MDWERGPVSSCSFIFAFICAPSIWGRKLIFFYKPLFLFLFVFLIPSQLITLTVASNSCHMLVDRSPRLQISVLKGFMLPKKRKKKKPVRCERLCANGSSGSIIDSGCEFAIHHRVCTFCVRSYASYYINAHSSVRIPHADSCLECNHSVILFLFQKEVRANR